MARVLVVAPISEGLPDVATATQAIASAHQPRLLQSADTTAREIVEAASEGGYDILWFFGHLTGGGGFALVNDELSVDSLVSAVNMSGASLCILTVCASWRIARQILQRTTAAVIYTNADVLAPEAMLVTVALAKTLARASNYREAFDLAQPGDLYTFQDNRNMAEQREPQFFTNNTTNIDRLYKMIDDLRERQFKATDDLRKEQAVLQNQITRMEALIADLQATILDLRNRVPPTSRLPIGIEGWFTILFVMLLAIGALTWISTH